MKAHRWTDEDLQEVKAKRVRGGAVGKPGATSVEPLRSVNARQPVGSNPASSPKHPYKSKLELAWATRLEVMKRNGEIDGWIYEPFTFRLAEGKRYRADFIAWKVREYEVITGEVVQFAVTTCYECKGWHRNYRDSLTHLKWAAQRFPFFQWKKVVRNGKSGFEVYDVVV